VDVVNNSRSCEIPLLPRLLSHWGRRVCEIVSRPLGGGAVWPQCRRCALLAVSVVALGAEGCWVVWRWGFLRPEGVTGTPIRHWEQNSEVGLSAYCRYPFVLGAPDDNMHASNGFEGGRVRLFAVCVAYTRRICV